MRWKLAGTGCGSGLKKASCLGISTEQGITTEKKWEVLVPCFSAFSQRESVLRAKLGNRKEEGNQANEGKKNGGGSRPSMRWLHREKKREITGKTGKRRRGIWPFGFAALPAGWPVTVRVGPHGFSTRTGQPV